MADGGQQARQVTEAPVLRCRHFGACGGCDWLDTPVAAQLARKARAVAEALANAGLTSGVPVDAIVAAPHAHFYRNRLLYPLAQRGGRIVGGFYARGSHDLVDVAECKIQDPAITEIAARVKSAIGELGLPVAPFPGVVSEGPPRAEGAVGLRAVAVRVAPGTGQALVGLVTTGGVETRLRALAERCLDAGDGLKTATGLRVRVRSVVRSLQDADTNVLLGRRVVPLLGSDRIEDLYMGLRLKLSLTSFFQPNGAAARAAFRQVVEYAREHSCRRAVDAYAGIGVAAMVLAPSVERVAAIEEVRSAVRDGRVNCQANGAANVEYLEGSVETKLGEALGGEPLDLVVLDPPRRGLTPEALTAVVERRPARVAYLSCSIASLARDLQGLDAAYALERIIPFDFLPQTEHVEVLAFLRRR